MLQDSERRAAYDRHLALSAAQQDVHVSETVCLEEMEGPTDVEGQACYTWPCRCGGAYLLLEEDASSAAGAATAGGGEESAGTAATTAAAELAVPCSTCSLHIRVLLLPAQQQHA